MLLDLDMPLPGVALVRLTLGECYLAAGDTTRGRIVLTRLGRDPQFREAGGHAHYHLARLDLAQGNLATAQDRFAVVALDNPAAPYANDALELGLAIAEEMDNASGGPDFLLLYSQAVYHDLVAQPQKRMEALENFIRVGRERLDLEEPQHLLERARWELAGIYAGQDRAADAVAVCRDIVRDHPQGRFPAEALMLQSDLLLRQGDEARARAALEQLLAQYPDYLFVDDARDILRSLP
jgi:tetratricopeptide (TPR) repeat protein